MGVVAPFDYLFKGRDGHEQTYHEEIDRCAARSRPGWPGRRVDRLLRDAGLLVPVDAVAGDGWVLVGDAFGFLDPLYSSGVLLALRSGEMAADAIVEGLAQGRHERPRSWAAGEPAFNEGVDRMRRLVCEFYDGFSFGRFVRAYPDLRGTVTDLLIGDLFTERVDKVWPAMESLYQAGKRPIPSWNAGVADEGLDGRAPHLTLPDGHRP